MKEQFLSHARRALAWTSCLAMLAATSAACGSEDPDGNDPLPGAGGSDDAGGSDPDGAGGAGGEDAETRRYALFVGSDFSTKAELAVIDLDADSVAGNLVFEDQDTMPYASGARGFALHRTDSSLDLLDEKAPWEVVHSIEMKEEGLATNPYAAVVAAGDTAYVVRYAHNTIRVVDLATGKSTGKVDLSGLLHPDDPDGFVDAMDGVYDAVSKRAYFLMGRIDQSDFSGPGPDYVSRCLSFGAAIVGVDTATNEIIDLNGDAPGEVIELSGQNPSALAADFASNRLIVVQAGCHLPAENEGDEALRDKRGIEAVSLDTGDSTWLYETTELDRLSYLLWLGPDKAYVGKGFPTQWHAWKPSEAKLGDLETSMPEHPLWDGKRIVGLSSSEDDRADVVAFDPETREISPIASGIFTSSGLYPYGSAIIR